MAIGGIGVGAVADIIGRRLAMLLTCGCVPIAVFSCVLPIGGCTLVCCFCALRCALMLPVTFSCLSVPLAPNVMVYVVGA